MLTPKWTKKLCGWLCLLAWFLGETQSIGNNRLTKTVTGGSEPGHWAYRYNEANQLVDWVKRVAVGGTPVKYAELGYDANGNRRSQRLWEGSGVHEGRATLANQGIAYESAASESAAAGLRVQLLQGEPGGALSVAVDDRDVNVTLAQSAWMKSEATYAGITYRAREAGAAGNALRVALTTSSTSSIAVEVAEPVVTVKLPLSEGAKASLVRQGMTLTAAQVGSAGNQIQLTFDYAQVPEDLLVSMAGGHVMVELAHDGAGNVTSTTAEVAAAINANIGTVVTATGGGGTIVATGYGQLSGGQNPALYKTRSEVMDAIEGNTAANDLLEVIAAGAEAVILTGQVELSGGQDPAPASTVTQVVALLQAEQAVAELMTVSGGGLTMVQPLPQTALVLNPVRTEGEGQLTTYTWDAQDRLTGVTMADGKAYTYQYDYRTRRIGIGEGGTITNPKQTAVLFAGGLSLAEYETPTAQTLIATPQSTTVHYLRGPDMGGGVGGMLYSVRGSELKYSISNGRGDIVAQSNANAEITWTASYEAYGKRPKETGSNADKQRANSKDEDPTGLLNEGFRYRDIETGMFMSRDPAGFVDGPNVYAYVKQNPWSAFDPKGLDAVYVAFPDHPISIPKGLPRAFIKTDKQGFSTDVGHAGVLLIDPESGKANYYEFGRYDKPKNGKYTGMYRKNDRGSGTDSVALPNIKFGADGKPTKESFEAVSKRLSEAIAGEHGKPERLEMAYFSSSKKAYEKQKAAADAAMESNNDPERKPYSPMNYNCGDFARDTIDAGGETKLKDSDAKPKYEVKEHQKKGDSYSYTPSDGLNENEKKKR